MEDAPQASDRPRSTIADRHALGALRWHWGDAYEIEVEQEHGWHAKRRDGLGSLLTAPGPDELYKVIEADYALRPVPRNLPGHDATPADFTAYSMEGPNTGQVANPANAWHFPAEGICAGCGAVIRAESFDGGWHHTGRKPGDLP